MVASGIFFAAPAHAAGYGCAGSEIDSYAVRTDSGTGTVYGYVHLYYDSSTGKNCAVNVATSAGGYGVYKPMTIILWECAASDTNCNNPYEEDYDQGSYSQYAGPVSVTAPGHCVRVAATIQYKGEQGWLVSPLGHCG
ncbi:hypothetical protein [Streptomyces sp. NBC_01637]|uniref:hypothetical protein n=1 Tax=unclassified Streptomyces TaxID=2593676 RepID=UPI0038669CC7|nr:hypothetical protein OH719_28430 [Streptomyces sp. NBC_01653]WTD89441.1 hypothetical protein OG891_18440 [Streptomyces sp. NBC_01637]